MNTHKIDRYIHIENPLTGIKVSINRYFQNGRHSMKEYYLNIHDEVRINQLNNQLSYSVDLTNGEMEVIARWAR